MATNRGTYFWQATDQVKDWSEAAVTLTCSLRQNKTPSTLLSQRETNSVKTKTSEREGIAHWMKAHNAPLCSEVQHHHVGAEVAPLGQPHAEQHDPPPIIEITQQLLGLFQRQVQRLVHAFDLVPE